MNTCGNCKYRGEQVKVYDSDKFEYIDTTYFKCDLIKHDNWWKYEKGQGAVTIDGSGYQAALCVENDFGCAKWESK